MRKKIHIRVPHKLRSALAFSLVAVIVAIISTPISHAANETYTWDGPNAITMDGIALQQPAHFTLYTDTSGKSMASSGNGGVVLHEDSERYCKVTVTIAVSSNFKTGKITSAIPTQGVSDGSGPISQCSSTEQDIIDGWKDSTITISGDRNSGTETKEQQYVNVVLVNPNKKSDSPKKVNFSIKSADGKLSTNFDSNIGEDGNYYGTFTGVSPGKWKVCVDKIADTKCKTIKKVKYSPITVYFGEGEQSQLLRVIVKFDDTIPVNTSLKIDLKKDGKTLESKEAKAVGTTDELDFPGMKPGKYQACYKTRCVEDTKKESVQLVMTLDLNKADIEGTADSTTTCSIEGIGWIVCPVLTFVGKLNDAAFGFLNNFLQVEPKLLTDTDTRAAWSSFRDIANVAFVIAFIIIVYSQISGMGISNYGIKRMLPRLFIAAVLVNISYYVCQIAVDLSNILGGSIYSFFKDVPTTSAGTVGFGDGLSWEKVAGYALAATATVLVGILALSTISTAALLAFALIILILIARKALLILLVVISPLAFVAYLLPNTERWFKKWWKAFSGLLMVFPIVGVIFGASTLAARIVNNAGAGENPDGGDQYLLQITALGIMAIPLFAVPIVLKGMMSAAGSIGAKIASWQDKANGAAKGQAGKRVERYKNRFNAANIGRSNNIREGSGRILGSSNSRRRRMFAGVAGLGATRAVDNEQKDKYAKVASEAAARSYVADRASESEKYATRLAGGDEKLAGYVQAYALQDKEEEFEKDVKAAQVLERNARRTKEQLHARVVDESLARHERVAAMRQFKEVANADETQKMVESLAAMGATATAPGATQEQQETVQKIQGEFDRAFAGSPLVPASVSGTDRGSMRNGVFSLTRDQRIKRDLEGDGVKGSKIGSDYILKMDVDEMYEWATDPSATATLAGLDPAAKARFISAIEEAANDDIKGNQFEARQIEQLKKIAATMGGAVNVTNPKYASKWT